MRQQILVEVFIATNYNILYNIGASITPTSTLDYILKSEVLPNIYTILTKEAEKGNLGKYVVRLLKKDNEKINKGTSEYYIFWLFIIVYGVDMTTDYKVLADLIDTTIVLKF